MTTEDYIYVLPDWDDFLGQSHIHPLHRKKRLGSGFDVVVEKDVYEKIRHLTRRTKPDKTSVIPAGKDWEHDDIQQMYSWFLEFENAEGTRAVIDMIKAKVESGK